MHVVDEVDVRELEGVLRHRVASSASNDSTGMLRRGIRWRQRFDTSS